MDGVARSEFWRGKRVLVTGAGGFVGGNLAARLSVANQVVRFW